MLLLALTGAGTPEGLSAPGLVRATLAAAAQLPEADVVAVPLASRGDAEADHLLGQRVVAAYAPGDVLGVAGEGDLPDEVADLVDADRPGPAEQGLVLFFTGLSGSGKSTLARALHDVVLEQGERTVTSLDGDVVRRNLSAGLTFSKADRETNIRRIGWVAAEISRHGGVAICSPIAPFDATRKQVRAMVDEAGGAFVLVHVATPLEECERRDRKGLYAKARRGEIPEFTGISSPYEEPEDALVRVDTTGRIDRGRPRGRARAALRGGLPVPPLTTPTPRKVHRVGSPHHQRIVGAARQLRRRHRRRPDRHGRRRPDDAGPDLPRREPDGRGRQRPGRRLGEQVRRRGRALAGGPAQPPARRAADLRVRADRVRRGVHRQGGG